MSSIVLVHGGFVDGSGWEPVYRILRESGHAVTVVQNPTTSLADDVAVTRRAPRPAVRPSGARRAFLRRRGHH